MLDRAALAGIWAYQQFVSPRKGYACAYRVAHGGSGCSGFAKQQIRDLGVLAALPAIRKRFAACQAAAVHMQSAQASRARPFKRKRSRWDNSWDASLCCSSGPSPCGRGKFDVSDGCDAGSCSP